MDQSTLEYLINNATGLIISGVPSFMVGSLTQYIQDLPQSGKLGYATLSTFGVDLIELHNKNIVDVSKNDIGNILGWYIGFNLGTLTNRGIKKIVKKYKSKNLYHSEN